MGIEDTLQDKREAILQIAAKHSATNLRVFGSIARGEVTPDSDVDLLIDLSIDRSPWFPVDFIAELEE